MKPDRLDKTPDAELIRRLLERVRTEDPLTPLETILGELNLTFSELDDIKSKNKIFNEAFTAALNLRNQKAVGLFILNARRALLERLEGKCVRERAATERTGDGKTMEIKERFFPADTKAILHVLDELDPLFGTRAESEAVDPPKIKFIFPDDPGSQTEQASS